MTTSNGEKRIRPVDYGKRETTFALDDSNQAEANERAAGGQQRY